LEVLQWARENGCPWDDSTCTCAAQNGHLEVLQWARENGCAWDESKCVRAAARNSHVHVLQWALESGCEQWNHYFSADRCWPDKVTVWLQANELDAKK
jgi:hypothetical protein